MFSGIHTAECNAKKNTNTNILKLTMFFFFNASPTVNYTERYLKIS